MGSRGGPPAYSGQSKSIFPDWIIGASSRIRPSAIVSFQFLIADDYFRGDGMAEEWDALRPRSGRRARKVRTASTPASRPASTNRSSHHR